MFLATKLDDTTIDLIKVEEGAKVFAPDNVQRFETIDEALSTSMTVIIDGEEQEKQAPPKIVTGYFEMAAMSLIFKKGVDGSFPALKKNLEKADDDLIKQGAYDGLADKQKASLLVSRLNA